MKKVTAALVALILTLSLAACTGGTPSKADQQVASVATSFVKEAQLYLPNENMDGFVLEAEECDGSFSTIVDMLVGRGAIPDGSEANSFEPDGKDGAALDMNAFYGNAVASTGTTGEYIMLGSLVNTMLKTYGLKHLRLTVDGKDLQTGHDIYDYDLTFYENQVSESVSGNPAVLWERLNGYWNAADAYFVNFGTKNGAKVLDYGIWDTGFGRGGSVMELSEIDADGWEVAVHCPALPATEMDDAVPEKTVIVELDASGLEQDGKVRMRIDGGDWKQYAYAGATAQEAIAASDGGDSGTAALAGRRG